MPMNEQLKNYILSTPCKMAFQIDDESIKNANTETQTIPMTFAAPYYVERWYGILVLDYSPQAIILDRWKQGAPYLMDHNTEDQRGIILEGDLINSKLNGKVKFSRSERGKELYQDIVDKIRPYTSMGFDILDIKEMTPEEMPDDLKNMAIEKQLPVFYVSKWMPFEGSSVALPANPEVGVQYDYYDGKTPEEVKILSEKFGLQKLEQKQQQITINKEAQMSESAVQTQEQLQELQNKRKATFLNFGKAYENRVAGGKNTIEKLAEDTAVMFVSETDESAERKFRGALFTKVQDKENLETPISMVGMTEKNKEQYSIMRVIRHLVDGKEELGIEKDIHEEILKKKGGMTNKTGSICLPMDIFTRRVQYTPELLNLMRARGMRSERFDQVVGTPSLGGYLVGTEHRAQDFIEYYYNLLIEGFTILPGLQQNIDIPKQVGGSTISIPASEGGGFLETSITFGQLLLSPKEIGAFVEITRKLLVQSSPAIDALVSLDLMRQMALKTNKLALFGTGATGEPLGVFNTSGVGTFPGAGISRSAALEAMADIGSANVVGTLKWLCNNATKALLMGRDQTAGYGQWLMDDQGVMVGFEDICSEQMAANYLALGKWDEVVVGQFGSMEILYDRNTLSNSGGLRIAVYDLIDCGLKHPGAVSYASDVS